jgi:hypothetical protein
MARARFAAAVALVLAAIGGAWAAGAALAAEGEKPADASITVLAIRAAKEDKPYIDPALKALAEDLKKTAASYNAFRLLMQVPRSVAFGETKDVPLVEGYTLRVRPVQEKDDTIELALTMVLADKDPKEKPREILSTTLRIRKGKYMLLGGWRLKEGTLLTAVSAR